MIDFLKGEIVAKRPAEVVIQVGGIGYSVHVPLSTYEHLQESHEFTLLTHLYVREDGWKLYGFATPAERDLFLLLISVSGIGPATALAALSGGSVSHIRDLILQENAAALTRIKGIGKKTAQRIIVELKEQVAKMADSVPRPVVPGRRNLEDVERALVNLGYTRAVAQRAAWAASEKLGPESKTEDLLREALKQC